MRTHISTPIFYSLNVYLTEKLMDWNQFLKSRTLKLEIKNS